MTDILVRYSGKAYAAWGRKCLQARRDVDGIADKIASTNHYVPYVDPYAEAHPAILGHALVRLC